MQKISQRSRGMREAAGEGRKSSSSDHRKLRSLLELGQLIGLDLDLDEMLLQIARKAAQVMGAERFSIFLHDAKTDELYTTVALGLGRQSIRIPAEAGVAGYCFRTGATVNLEDAHADPRLNRAVEAQTGYATRTLLSMPLHNRAGRPIGVTQLLNKRRGVFTDEDRVFLGMFNNHAAVFIEMAQLQQARIDALERSRQELERLNQAKTKAVNHIAHELKTPIAVIQAYVRRLKRSLQSTPAYPDWQESFATLERNLTRVSEIQKEAGQILRLGGELEAGALLNELERLWGRVEGFSPMPPGTRRHWDAVRSWMSQHLPGSTTHQKWTSLYPFVRRLTKRVKVLAPHRDLVFEVEGARRARVFTDQVMLGEVLLGLIRNAFENTPDKGSVTIRLEEQGGKSYIQVADCGIGIVDEDKVSLFDGLSPARDIECYTSKRPYDFGAGGKGLDLLRMRLYAERFGFEFSMKSKRCAFLPTDRDLCPGDVSLCSHCRVVDDCLASGGSTFTVAFALTPGPGRRSGRRASEVKH